MSPTLAAEALFVSDLQPSDRPDAVTVKRAVEAVLGGHDACWCAETMAAEFGEHPEQAAERMRWCRCAVDTQATP